MDELKPLPCPFCGKQPEIHPCNPETQGDAWGMVACANPECPARPKVDDGETDADDRGSDAYKALAIKRWNTRPEVKTDA